MVQHLLETPDDDDDDDDVYDCARVPRPRSRLRLMEKVLVEDRW